MNGQSTPNRYVLALDPGGSKCEGLLIAAGGTVLAGTKVQEPGRSGRSLEVVGEVVRQLVAGVSVTELHIATVSVNALAGELGIPPGVAVTVHEFCESDGPLMLIDAPAGIVVIAGTGARVIGRTASGRELSLDGVGPMLGDHGGGYQIGLQALRATALAVRHPRHHTRLTEPVFVACEEYMRRLPDPPPRRRRPSQMTGFLARAMARRAAESKLDPAAARLYRLVDFSLTSHDRSVVASLARIVDAEARAGDPVSIRILRDAAGALAETVRDLVDHLGGEAAGLPLVGIGSVIVECDLYWDHFCQLLREFAPTIRPLRTPFPPLVGNALAVFQELPGVDYPTLRTHLLETARAYYQRSSP